MESTKIFARSLITLSLFMIAFSLFSQEKNLNIDFTPEVGQPGKDVVWVPTPQELVDKMLSIAEVTSKDFVIDLGSGDGRTVISAAKLGARARGIEYNPDMVELSKKNAAIAGVSDKTEFIEADLFETDFSQATVITMFLLPEINLRLRPRLLDLKPGTRVVSNTFTMGEWEPDYEADTDENWNSWNRALLWIVPAKVEGKWKIGQSNLTFTQEFQFVQGTIETNGETSRITDGRLRGDIITFTIDGVVYTGRVSGNTMSGTLTRGSTKSDWLARKSG
jgi:SAM-dependent methyltransferase